MAKFPLTNIEDMQAYIEEKFSGTVYTCKASTNDPFADVVKWHVVWTPVGERGKVEEGPIWCGRSGYTAAVFMGEDYGLNR